MAATLCEAWAAGTLTIGDPATRMACTKASLKSTARFSAIRSLIADNTPHQFLLLFKNRSVGFCSRHQRQPLRRKMMVQYAMGDDGYYSAVNTLDTNDSPPDSSNFLFTVIAVAIGIVCVSIVSVSV